MNPGCGLGFWSCEVTMLHYRYLCSTHPIDWMNEITTMTQHLSDVLLPVCVTWQYVSTDKWCNVSAGNCNIDPRDSSVFSGDPQWGHVILKESHGAMPNVPLNQMCVCVNVCKICYVRCLRIYRIHILYNMSIYNYLRMIIKHMLVLSIVEQPCVIIHIIIRLLVCARLPHSSILQ